MALPIWKRPVDLLLAAFFILHLPIAVLIDGQMIFPKHWYPSFLKAIVQFHIVTNGDFLVRDLPPYYKALVVCEFAIQLPLHIACGYAFIKGAYMIPVDLQCSWAFGVDVLHNVVVSVSNLSRPVSVLIVGLPLLSPAVRMYDPLEFTSFDSHARVIWLLCMTLYSGRKWGRMPGIIYGVHTATTMVPILGDLLASQEPQKFILIAIYLPYLILPLIVVARLLPYSDPFAAPVGISGDKKSN